MSLLVTASHVPSIFEDKDKIAMKEARRETATKAKKHIEGNFSGKGRGGGVKKSQRDPPDRKEKETGLKAYGFTAIRKVSCGRDLEPANI